MRSRMTALAITSRFGTFMRRVVSSLMIVAFLPAISLAQTIPLGTHAPEIDLPTLQGGRIKLSALRGHPVVVTFWGTWCPPCRDELIELVAAHKTYRDRGLVVLAVNQRDQELGTNDVQAFITEHAVEFTVALDRRGESRRTFRLLAIPTTVFIDSGGMIQRVRSGAINRADLAEGLAMILPAK